MGDLPQKEQRDINYRNLSLTLVGLLTIASINLQPENLVSAAVENSSATRNEIKVSPFDTALAKLRSENPEIRYSPEQQKYLEDLFENPGLNSIRIEISHKTNQAKIQITLPDGQTQNIKTLLTLPKQDKAKYLPNGYYVNASLTPAYNYEQVQNYRPSEINVAEPVDDVVILNALNIQEIVSKNGDLKIEKQDDNPDGQRKLHSRLFPGNLANLVRKDRIKVLSRNSATDPETGPFTALRKNNYVLAGDLNVINKYVIPNQAGKDISWGCIRLDPALSNKIFHEAIRLRHERKESSEESQVNNVFSQDIRNLPKDHYVYTVMLKLVD